MSAAETWGSPAYLGGVLNALIGAESASWQVIAFPL